jgi:preprotein translocase subunit SecY
MATLGTQIAQLAQFLPSVKKPDRNVSFKEKLSWTGVVLVLYFIMGSVYLVGVQPTQLEYFQSLQTVLGAQIGTLITLGIGPIVSASIILQLLVGSDILRWDTNTPEGRMKFQNTQKLLAYGFALFEAIAFTLMGAVTPQPGMEVIVIAQLALGGWLIILMDEIVSKWGFHSGVSLFILAGVSQTIVLGMISPFSGQGGQGIQQLWFMSNGTPSGALLQIATLDTNTQTLLGLVSTVAVFLVAVYAESMRVEIPLTFGNVRGFGRKWPLKFVYTNVIPVIFVSAIVSNMQLMNSMLAGRTTLSINSSFIPWSSQDFFLIPETYTPGSSAANELMFYFSSPQNIPYEIIQNTLTLPEIAQTFTYTSFYVVSAAVFSIFWMKTSGQDPSSVADQIMDIGMKIPGFRKDKRVIVKILDRYIPALSVLGGAFIGFLAAVANFTNSFGTGTGMLLAVMIAFQFYEEVVKKHMEEMHPALRNFMDNMG